MKAPEMARKIGDVLDSLEAITEAEMRETEWAAASPQGAAADRLRARVLAERQLLELHGSSHVCSDQGLPWLATPYEIDGEDGEACWTLRWLARAHQVIAFPATVATGPVDQPAIDALSDLAKATARGQR